MNAHQRRLVLRLKERNNVDPPAWARAGPKVHKVINPKDGKTAPEQSPRIEAKPQTKTGAFASARAFCSALEKRGYKLLGSGAYSSVYGKDGYDKVLKVSRCLDNWIDYVAWASSNGYAGNLAPKVFSWKRFKNPGDPPEREGFYGRWDERQWSVAVVERMVETVKEDSKLSQDFKIIERLHDLAGKSILAELVVDEIVPGCGKFFKELHANFYASDIYSKNLMVRKDGSFCVTDPVCGRIKTEAIRFRAGEFSPPLILTRRYFESSSRH